ncbi:type II toxin-antitoxin system Phd/YefM family antitoxin [Streptomyces sp. NPDC002785]|uniref:type II toxin-antitoxin system Phd/YefM family antitoxin n=1 Tax=Streptomyces sp. NPDC002785 TaxID=3154543 RepID=UPI00331B178D
MNRFELPDDIEDFGHLVALVEETGERVSITAFGEPECVLLPAAEWADLEHWAQRGYGAPIPLPDAAQERPPGPEQHGPYIRYVHADGVRMTFTRGRVVVAELRSAGELDWLEEWARNGRQGYMDPKQAAAFAEFLARQEGRKQQTEDGDDQSDSAGRAAMSGRAPAAALGCRTPRPAPPPAPRAFPRPYTPRRPVRT